jgi:hypothetical protein
MEGVDTPESPADDEKLEKQEGASTHSKVVQIDAEILAFEADERPGLIAAYKMARIVSITLFLILVVLIPIPLVGSGYIWGKTGFTAYVSIVILWVFVSIGIVVLCESQDATGWQQLI